LPQRRASCIYRVPARDALLSVLIGLLLLTWSLGVCVDTFRVHGHGYAAQQESLRPSAQRRVLRGDTPPGIRAETREARREQ
jgi:hypothetical protein